MLSSLVIMCGLAPVCSTKLSIALSELIPSRNPQAADQGATDSMAATKVRGMEKTDIEHKKQKTDFRGRPACHQHVLDEASQLVGRFHPDRHKSWSAADQAVLRRRCRKLAKCMDAGLVNMIIQDYEGFVVQLSTAGDGLNDMD